MREEDHIHCRVAGLRGSVEQGANLCAQGCLFSIQKTGATSSFLSACYSICVFSMVFRFSMHTHRHADGSKRRPFEGLPAWQGPGRSAWPRGEAPFGASALRRAGLGLKVFDTQCLAVVPVLTDHVATTATSVLVIAALAGDLVGCYYLLLQPLLLLLLLFPLWLLWF